jgi:MFS family permease
MFQAGRFICGLGTGILVTICPMYLSELAPPAHRGWLVGHHAIFLVFGYMLAAWLGFASYFATNLNPSFVWRFPLAVQCLAPAVLLTTSFWIPRSPRWLIQKGHHDEAWDVLKKSRQSPEDPEHVLAQQEYYQAREQITLDSNKLRSLGVGLWGAVLKIKSYRKRMIVGFLTQWGAEFGGPLVIVSD